MRIQPMSPCARNTSFTSNIPSIPKTIVGAVELGNLHQLPDDWVISDVMRRLRNAWSNFEVTKLGSQTSADGLIVVAKQMSNKWRIDEVIGMMQKACSNFHIKKESSKPHIGEFAWTATVNEIPRGKILNVAFTYK